MPLPEDAATAVTAIVNEVRGQALPAGMHDVRWVRLEGLHLTLRFLGPTPDARIGTTTDAVRRAAATATPFTLTIAGSGAFPPGPRPRTLWLGLADGAEAMADLATRCGGALAEVGWAIDARPFRAHLTLARSDGQAAGPLVAARLAAAVADQRITARIERIGLFESVTGGGPARYVPLDIVALGAEPPMAPSVYHPT